MNRYAVADELAMQWGPVCSYCDAPLAMWGQEGLPVHIDHMTPRSEGGSDDLENLALSCGPCNASKGTAGLIEFCLLRRSMATYVAEAVRKRIDVDNIASVSEVADLCDVTRSLVYAWIDPKNRRHRPDFPAPITTVGENVRLWDLVAVEKWAAKNGYPKATTT